MSDSWIVSSPEVLGGKSRLRGTRISVEHLLELAASGASREQILAAYPQVTEEGLTAAFDYAASVLRNESLWEVETPA